MRLLLILSFFVIHSFVYPQDEDKIIIDCYNSIDSVSYDDKADSINILFTAEINYRGNLTFSSLNLYSKAEQYVYFIFDDIILIDNLEHTSEYVKVPIAASYITLYKDENDLNYLEEYNSNIIFPCYYKIDNQEKNRYDFSIELLNNDFRKKIDKGENAYAKVKLFYFLEEDLLKIEKELGFSIQNSRIQSRNFQTKFLIDIENKQINLLNLFDSNISNINKEKLVSIFKKYVKSIEKVSRIYHNY